MSKLNFLVYLNAYADKNASNSPSRSNFKWERHANSILASNPTSLEFSLAPGETRTLFDGSRTITQNNTTQWSITLVPFSSSSYQLSWVGGTQPGFRTSRTIGGNSSTNVTVTVNGPVVTFASTSGALWNLTVGGVVVGDYVRIGSQFNPANQGEWQIIALTNTSFKVVNLSGAAEGPINLGAGYASQVKIYSAAGVQIGDTLSITGGFSPATWGSYKITSVADTFLQFSSLNTLPQESSITTDDITVYYLAKKLIYLEADQHVALTINGVAGNEIDPLLSCDCSTLNPGVFMQSSTIYSLSITNDGVSTAKLFLASVE